MLTSLRDGNEDAAAAMLRTHLSDTEEIVAHGIHDASADEG
jgi:DNA-binding GntR family transcriptional regulator